MSAALRELEQLFGVAPQPRRVRRLDNAALEQAAQRTGHADARAALHDALVTVPEGARRLLVLDVLAGRLPGAMSRQLISRALGVSEYLLWPVVVAS